ncbi:bifunctional methylenetetrahydrofolate dehydrogenase/methenyltetrahydrofolate cyclohydrolase FolD [Eubacterium ventriosum]|jgi:methylenetetrahydrofolate dehydrogenase (NADP+)/methenyltetrahydrofolate cyclohydrolase|uniref:Bifunctional protein FolD n=1 Tax=Eubacterium ventriosum TaxID=39496 RepID=A0A413S677_9FIRM|nr:bifunctional methylenetetrahydrofolate dehydrogenase/methenyltetrahydrofolate cyclohydrolase FolD [Eubacterium ventriosum]PWM02182.1 MAG: bifunctional methylenetetrahydrofolate dehydrogenase/methenyltetrahydrofolate cyclohydrolase FolD [Eubacterium ventriosum]RHA57376.1 bifunctional methylenetetrahydrofolate dehydrogenase/methenyltetrahydrofolate cyclohydrolase FolD [Eubacterium ventriosum]
MAKIIDGKQISLDIKNELKEKVAKYKEQGIEITLAVVKVGNDPASAVYVRNKEKACEYVGINSKTLALPEETTEEELLNVVKKLNEDKNVNGILVQLPLPKHIDESKVLLTIDSTKDVDGFHPVNVGKMVIGEDTFLPCTPAGIIEMIKRTDIDIEGKECVVIGRSNIVGKPMAMLMLKENATVTIAHSRTKDLKEVTKRADIIVAAIGKAKFVTADYVKEGAVVIDVGMDRDENGKLCGDVDFESVSKVASAITPVPGGVGPMTVTMLLVNCLRSVELNK